MEIRIRNVRFRRRLVIFVFFSLLICLPETVLSQSAPALDAEWKESILENQRFTLKYITPYPGKQAVAIQDPLWPQGIQKVSGPYTAQSTIQKEDGTFATVLQIIYTLRSGGAGIYRIPPVTVTPRRSQGQQGPLPDPLSGKELYIPVLRSDERHLRFPLDLQWESLPSRLYVGQSVPLILVMNNLEEIDLPESVSLASPGGAILENVEGLGDIGFSGLDTRTLFNVPMDAWMLTPSRDGTLTLPAAEVRIAGVSRSTPRRSIAVDPLPPGARNSGAVGDFILTAELSDATVLPGGSLSLSLRLEGTGNLNFLNMPEPVFPEELAYAVRDTAVFEATFEGYTGFRERIYTLRPEELGQYDITLPSYAWFNPQSDRVESRSDMLLSFTVAGHLPLSGEMDQPVFHLMKLEEGQRAEGWTFYRIPQLYLLLLPGVFFLAALLLIKRFRPSLLSALAVSILLLSSSGNGEDPPSWIGRAEESFEQGQYSQALALYRNNHGDWHENGTFLYNQGVLTFLAGDQSGGIAFLRKAMARLPMNRQVQETLKDIEELMRLENQHRASLLVHPDLLFLLFIAGFNGAMAALGYSFLRKTSLPVLLFLFLSVLSLFSGGELLRVSWLLNRPLAVLSQGGAVKKIPEGIASDWLILPEGTSVEYRKKVGDYILVNTAYGLEGWVRKEQLLFLKEAPGEF